MSFKRRLSFFVLVIWFPFLATSQLTVTYSFDGYLGYSRIEKFETPYSYDPFTEVSTPTGEPIEPSRGIFIMGKMDARINVIEFNDEMAFAARAGIGLGAYYDVGLAYDLFVGPGLYFNLGSTYATKAETGFSITSTFNFTSLAPAFAKQENALKFYNRKIIGWRILPEVYYWGANGVHVLGLFFGMGQFGSKEFGITFRVLFNY